MDIQALLQNKKCSCGMEHTCSIRNVVIGSGAIQSIAELTAAYKNILLVADENTYAVCGNQVEKLLTGKLDALLVYKRDGLLVPNEEAIAEMEACLSEKTDLIIGVGSGVIQDLCKYVSFDASLPYYIVATAPSMDGYASKGAAMILGNMKVTTNAHVPQAIIGDIDILRDAPMDMIRSGYGDILGKYSCLNDWKLSHVILDEYLCKEVYDLTYEMVLKTKDLGTKLQQRDPDAVQTLMEALVGVGIAMAYVGNSRPASGSEHHLSHFFEVTGILNDEPYFMHGTDVLFSAIYTQKLREELLGMEKPVCLGTCSKEKWETDIREIYTDAAEGVIALQNKLGWYERDLVPVYAAKWSAIKEVLAEAPSSAEMQSYAESIGLVPGDFITTYGETKIQNALRYAKDLKDRYSVLWTYYDLMHKQPK